MLTTKCLKCKKKFLVHASNKKRGYGKYCSRKCYDESRYRYRKGIYKKCLQCGKQSYAMQSKVKIKKFCSRKCQHKYYTKGELIKNRKMTPAFARLIGHIFGDGCIQIQKYTTKNYDFPKGYRIRYTNKEPKLMQDFCQSTKKCYPFIKFTHYRNNKTHCLQVDINGKNIVAELLPMIKNKQHIPKQILKANKKMQAHFIGAFYDDEGSVNIKWYIDRKRGSTYDCWQRQIAVVNNNKKVIEGIKKMLKQFGIETSKLRSFISTRGGKAKPSQPCYRIDITGLASFINFKKYIPIKHPKKIKRLNKILKSYKYKHKIKQINQILGYNYLQQ